MNQSNNSLKLPRSHSNRDVLGTLAKTLLRPKVGGGALIVAFVVFSFIVLAQNVALITSVVSQPTVNLGEKVVFVGSLYGSIGTNFSLFTASVTVVIASLFGLNGALLVYYIKTVRSAQGSLKVGSSSVGGLVSGLLGIGCAACGTFILSTLLTSFGAAGLLLVLPLRGEEFGLIGIVLLSYSIWLIGKKLQQPFVCPV